MPHTSQPVLVTWRDCFTSNHTWIESTEGPEDPVIVNSVGWIVPDHLSGYLVLTDAWFERDGTVTYGTLTYIPDGMVVTKASLGWVKPS